VDGQACAARVESPSAPRRDVAPKGGPDHRDRLDPDHHRDRRGADRKVGPGLVAVDASVDRGGGRRAGRSQEQFQESARDCRPWAWADAAEKSGVTALESPRRRLVLRRRVRLVGADAVPAVGPGVQQSADRELGAPEAVASAASQRQHRQEQSREEWLVSEEQQQARMERKQRAPELQISLPQGQLAERQEPRMAQA